jgi:hypothetical protein
MGAIILPVLVPIPATGPEVVSLPRQPSFFLAQA